MVKDTKDDETCIPEYDAQGFSFSLNSLKSTACDSHSKGCVHEEEKEDDLQQRSGNIQGQKQEKENGAFVCSSLLYCEHDDDQGSSSATVVLKHDCGSAAKQSIGAVPPSPLTDDEYDKADVKMNNPISKAVADILLCSVQRDAPTPDEDSESNDIGPIDSSPDESTSASRPRILNLQRQLQVSHLALQSADQKMRKAQKIIHVLQKKCADLESAQSSSSHDSNLNPRDVLERLRAKNAALIEQCSLLQTMSDKDTILVRELRSAYSSINHQKTEMEVEFCNQLSTLSATIKSTEDDNMEQLNAKRNIISSLKAHINSQDDHIIKLQDELYELKEELLTTAKTDLFSCASSSTDRINPESSSKVLILGQEKKLLLERVEFLTLNRTAMTEEVDELRDRVSQLSELESKVVPQLKEKLEATRDSLRSLEQDMHMICKNHKNAVEKFEKSLTEADLEKIRFEEDFLQQIIGLNKQKNSIVLDYRKENAEKDVVITSFQKQIVTLRDKILLLQSKSELEEISGREETERLFQMHMVTEEKLSEQDAIIQELKFTIREEKKMNASLTKELKKYQQTDSGKY